MSTAAEYLVISSSLRQASNSRILADALQKAWTTQGASSRLLDLRDFPLPFCDAGEAYEHEHIPVLTSALEEARVIVVATPIYNYSINAVVKNLIELTGRKWENKVVGFLCAAGGQGSYMSIMHLANSLMLDFRCLIIPRFVYAVSKDFAGGKVSSQEVQERIDGLAVASMKIRNA